MKSPGSWIVLRLSTFLYFQMVKLTLPETNSKFAPENGWLELLFFYWDDLFSGAMLVSGRVFKECLFRK